MAVSEALVACVSPQAAKGGAGGFALGRAIFIPEVILVTVSEALVECVPLQAAWGEGRRRRRERHLGLWRRSERASSFIRTGLGGVVLKQFARASEVVEVRGSLVEVNRCRIPVGLRRAVQHVEPDHLEVEGHLEVPRLDQLEDPLVRLLGGAP